MSKPLDGVKFAATFIDDQTESDLINKIRSLKGEFYRKMASDVRFLVVGKRYTQKYSFALVHRITLISADVFFSIYLRWKGGEELDFVTELTAQKLKPFDGQFICLSNMESTQKEGFHELIESGGGKFSIPFTRSNTILVSPKASGRKVEGARKWGTPVVHPKWVSDSIKFGAALDPASYDVDSADARMEPPEVVVRRGSASREGDPEQSSTTTGVTSASGTNTESGSTSAPVLKRRRGGDFLTNAPIAKRDRSTVGPTFFSFSGPPPTLTNADLSNTESHSPFKDMRFHFEGFDSRQLGILNRAVRSLGGIVDSSNHEYLVVYSNSPMQQPGPRSTVKLVTEWALERSIYLKRNSLDDIWSKPVFLQPAEGFAGLNVSITGFQGIEQRHATLLIKMLGANFVETLKPDRDLLISSSETAHKVPYAVSWGIPVASIDWLWKCALTGKALPLTRADTLDGKEARLGIHTDRSASANFASTDGVHSLGSRDISGAASSGSAHASIIGSGPATMPASMPATTHNSIEAYGGGNVRYQDDDAEARAQVLAALGEKPSTPPEPEPETVAAVNVRPRRRK